MAFRVLVVCTANICRSPTGARALRRAFAQTGLSDLVVVASAGVAAQPGREMCDLADALSSHALLVAGPGTAGAQGTAPPPPPTADERLAAFGHHQARVLTPAIADDADLILCADRSHRAAVTSLAPRKRAATFTLRQAGRLAPWILGDSGIAGIAASRGRGEVVDLPADDYRALVPALPADPLRRLDWLVGELDANRGLAPVTDSSTYPQWEVDDIGDPHVLGYQLHEQTVRCTVDAATAFAGACSRLVTMT